MYSLLYLALEDSGPTGFIIFGDFQDVGSVDPVIGSAAHTMVAFAVELVDRHLYECQKPETPGEFEWRPTLLYVAE